MTPPSPARLAYYAGLVVTVAALTHIASLLLVPAAAEHDAYARVAALGPPFTTLPLPIAAPGERAFPYADPAVAASVCRYDLSGGPVRARVTLSQPGFAALTFHSRRGVIFYALTDRAATRGRMDALIVTSEQLRVLVGRDDEDNPSDDLRIVSPTTQGFVAMSALSRSPDDLAAAREEAAGMACASEPIAEAEK